MNIGVIENLPPMLFLWCVHNVLFEVNINYSKYSEALRRETFEEFLSMCYPYCLVVRYFK